MTTQTLTLPKVNLISPEFKANPFPFYAQLRESAPVYRTTMPYRGNITLVTRYDDVLALLKDSRFSKEAQKAKNPADLKSTPHLPGPLKALEYSMLDMDDPAHARLRNLVHKAFTPRLMEQMRDQIQTLADELISKGIARGQMDIVKDLALPLPLAVISKILGVPEKERPKFHATVHNVIDLGSAPNTLNVIRLLPQLYMFMRYLRQLARERRHRPQDDLITLLVQAEDAGDTLSEDELAAMVFLLLTAGYETTVNLISSGVLALLEYPEQLTLLRNDPTLIRSATEELLRYSAPVEQATERYALEDVTWHDVIIPKGELTYAVLASANRDPLVFVNPDTLDITREPNRHLSFGHGAHFCVGAPLARLEGQIAINTLVQRVPTMRLAVRADQLKWRSTINVRGLKSLPVVF